MTDWIRYLSQPNMVIQQIDDYKPFAMPTRPTRTTLAEYGNDNKGRPNWIFKKTIGPTILKKLISNGYLYGGEITEFNPVTKSATRYWWPSEKLYADSETIQIRATNKLC
jgi:hypothetical protein